MERGNILIGLKAGELAALYILALRGIYQDYTANEIQAQLEFLVGLSETIVIIRNIRKAIDGS